MFLCSVVRLFVLWQVAEYATAPRKQVRELLYQLLKIHWKLWVLERVLAMQLVKVSVLPSADHRGEVPRPSADC